MTPNRNNGVEYATLPWSNAFTSYEEQWASVIDQERLNPSLHPKWIDAFASSKGVVDQIRVLARTQDDMFAAVVPFLVLPRRIFGIQFTCLELTSNLVSYHAEVVSRSDPHEILERLLNGSSPWHIFRAANLSPDGPTASALHAIADQIGARLLSYRAQSSPYLPIKGSWESFLASKNKKFRYKYRQRKKLFDGCPDYSIRWFTQPRDIDVLLSDILQIESRSWKAHSRIDISSNNSEKQYYENLLPFLAERKSLFANILYVESRPIAYNLCCNWNGWVGQLKTSFDEEFKGLSPGSIVIDVAIQEAFRMRANEFDFLGDADGHKLSWTHRTRDHADYFLFAPAFRSRLLGFLKALRKRT